MPTFAAVDIGSNSVRLKIARLIKGRLREISEDREVTRLGESVFRNGFLSPEAIAGTVKVLRRFHRAVQKAAADEVRVVATSAMRDARNSRAFLEWVRSATGWQVEVISGLEEARLIHLGLAASLRASPSPVLMMDLGGGSCELTVSNHGHIVETVSLPLGAVRLTSEFLKQDPPRKFELQQLRGFVTREIGRISGHIVKVKPKTVIATSGTAEALALTVHNLYKSDASRGNSASRAQTEKLTKSLAKLPLSERRKLPGIGPRRAEIVVAGAMVYSELLNCCHLAGFRFSPLGLRDGILAQMAAEYDRGARSVRQIESERLDSIHAAARHYRVDFGHAARVRDAAIQLFTELRSVHSLPAEYREWLSAAAMLSEVGDYVNRNGRHRHTYYIISHSEILGYTPQQRRIIGAIARYLGKTRPSAGDPAMKPLVAHDREYVKKASLLLRLAVALNLSRGHAVAAFRTRVHAAEVKLELTAKPKTSVDLELWALEKDSAYFREIFGRELSAVAA